jgi:soluble lytic murein transglycosylase-like protein
MKSVLKLWCWAGPLMLGLAACAETAPLDQYFALRRQHQASIVRIADAATNPQACKGKLVELRGVLSGSARQDNQASIILNCQEACYVVKAQDLPEVSSGSRVCALVRVGEGCTMSLSDLELVALAYESAVAARERAVAEAEAASKAKRSAARSSAWRPSTPQGRQLYDPPSRSSQQLAAEECVRIYKNAIRSFNPKLKDQDADTIARSILAFGIKHQVDPRLVMAVILAESHFRPNATSPKGAMGLGQLMPGTAAGLGVYDAYDPVQNIAGSVRLIRGHLDRLSGRAPWNRLTWQDLALALASYNAGPGAVRKYGGIPPYRETQNYIRKVIAYYKALAPPPRDGRSSR